MTRAAIRKYQRDKNLAVNGQLDQETLNSLGIQAQGEASRSAQQPAPATPSTQDQPAQTQSTQTPPAQRQPAETQPTPAPATQDQSAQDQSAEQNGAVVSPSAATISAAQRSLKKEGFYKGDIDGQMTAETQAAISEYQKNSNLNVTGTLDPATLTKLGVSK